MNRCRSRRMLLNAMGILSVELEGYEADDILGTLSARCEKEGLDVVLVSGDRDMLQLASGRTKIRIPRTKRRIDGGGGLPRGRRERYLRV